MVFVFTESVLYDRRIMQIEMANSYQVIDEMFPQS